MLNTTTVATAVGAPQQHPHGNGTADHLMRFLSTADLVDTCHYFAAAGGATVVLLCYNLAMQWRHRRDLNHLWNRILLGYFGAGLLQALQQNAVAWHTIGTETTLVCNDGLCVMSFVLTQFLNVTILGSFTAFFLVIVAPFRIGEGGLDTMRQVARRHAVCVAAILATAAATVALALGLHAKSHALADFSQATSPWCWLSNKDWWLKLVCSYLYAALNTVLGTVLVVSIVCGRAGQHMDRWPVTLFVVGVLSWETILYVVGFSVRFVDDHSWHYSLACAFACMSGLDGAVTSALYVVCERLTPTREPGARGLTYFIVSSSPVPPPVSSFRERQYSEQAAERRRLLAANASMSTGTPPARKGDNVGRLDSRFCDSGMFVGLAGGDSGISPAAKRPAASVDDDDESGRRHSDASHVPSSLVTDLPPYGSLQQRAATVGTTSGGYGAMHDE